MQDLYSQVSTCIYTAQGEVICQGKKHMETFVEERPNIATKKDIVQNATLDNAMKQNYCDISMEVDPNTGKTIYSFKKNC